jgi:hypothetical protein
VRFTSDLIEKWKILKAEDPLDEWLLKERLDELGRLGDTLSITRERVSGGMGKQNHWGAWQASEEEIRMTFAPLAENICGALTKAYLRPMLRASGLSLVGENGGNLIVWYDISELTARPDMTVPAKDLYDRLEISGEALRRETGFSEEDAPDQIELRAMIWKKVAGTIQLAPTSVAQLTGGPTVAVPQAPGAGDGSPAAASDGATSPVTGPPDTMAEPPPSPDVGPPDMTAAAIVDDLITRINGAHPSLRR